MGSVREVTSRPPSPETAPLRLAAAALACGALMAVPFWIGRFVPFLDLPQHLALITVLLGQEPPGGALSAYFVPEWGEFTPYWLYYGAVSLLAPFGGVETASRILLTLYALLLPWGSIALCRAFHRPAALGLLAAPLILNANLYFGFVNYCLAGVLLLFVLARQERLAARPSLGQGVGLALLATALFFAHIQVFLFACLCATALVLVFPPAPLKLAARLRRLLPLVVTAATLCAPWFYRTLLGPRRDFGRFGLTTARYEPLLDRVTGLPANVAGNFADGSDTLLFCAWAACLGVLWLRARSTGAAEDGPAPRLLAVVALAAAGYFLAPHSIMGQWNIAPRFAWLGALCLPALLPSHQRLRSWATVAALGFSAVVGLNAAWHHGRFDTEVGAFDRLLAGLPPGQRLLPLMYDDRGAYLTRWPYLHLPHYYTVRRGGFVAGSFAGAGPLPVRLQRPRAWPHPNPFEPEELACADTVPAYDFVLSRGGPRLDGPTCPLVLVADSGPWRVYRVILAPPPAPVPHVPYAAD